MNTGIERYQFRGPWKGLRKLAEKLLVCWRVLGSGYYLCTGMKKDCSTGSAWARINIPGDRMGWCFLESVSDYAKKVSGECFAVREAAKDKADAKDNEI